MNNFNKLREYIERIVIELAFLSIRSFPVKFTGTPKLADKCI